MGLSVIIITKNEEDNICRCLDSVKWADEIVLVDSGSTDKTMELAGKYTDRLFIKEFNGYSEQKSYALSLAGHDWVLNIDADEALTPELQKDIRKIVENGTGKDGFWMPRLTYYLGRPIRHCGWYPDLQLRLFKRNNAFYKERKVHERIDVKGSCGRLKGDIIHYSYRSFDQQLEKLSAYARGSAEQMYAEGKRCTIVKMAINPIFNFFKKYMLQLGFLDGVRGFLISVSSAYYVYAKFASLWDLERRSRESIE